MSEQSFQDRLSAFTARVQDLVPTRALEEEKDTLKQLQEEMGQADFWSDAQAAQKVTQSAAKIEKKIATWSTLTKATKELPELVEMAQEGDMEVLEEELTLLEGQLEQAALALLFSGPYDGHNVLLTIKVGNGGQDAEDFAQMLLRMYGRWAEQNGYKVQLLDESRTDVGLKSATLDIRGDHAYGYLQAEHGVHRLIRMSPFNAKGLRQTSFARVEVLPQIEQDTDVDINPSDLRVDVFRSSGPGGQSVNTTDSAVRLTYIPLGLTVTCQNEKSQLQNKEAALRVLKSRLLQLKLEHQAEELSDLRGEMLDNSFGSQIRTYTLQPYKLVKDHRTDQEHTNPDKVFDGDLGDFLSSYLRTRA